MAAAAHAPGGVGHFGAVADSEEAVLAVVAEEALADSEGAALVAEVQAEAGRLREWRYKKVKGERYRA